MLFAMLYLLVILASACGPLLAALPHFWRAIKDKAPLWDKAFWIHRGIDAAFAFLFCSVVFLVGLFFNAPALWMGFLFYLLLATVLSFTYPHRWLLRAFRDKELDPKPFCKTLFGSVGILLCLALDGFFFNRSSLKSNDVSQEISLVDRDAVQSLSGFTPVENGAYEATQLECSLSLNAQGTNINRVTFVFEPSNTAIDLATFRVQGGNWVYTGSFDINPNNANTCTVTLIPGSERYFFRFYVDQTRLQNQSNFILKGMKTNQVIPYRVSILRLLFFTGIGIFLFHLPSQAKKAREAPKRAKEAKIMILTCLGLSLTSLLIIALLSPRGPDSFLVDYPIDRDTLTDYDLYVKLFDALKKGQLHFDVDADPKLLELGDRVYDPHARTAAHAEVLWDHVFYQGKYYSYFGVAPVILVSFPVYWLTHAAATGLLLQCVAFLFALAAFAYLSVLLTQLFRFSPHPLGYGLLVGMIAVSGLFLNLVVFRITDFKYRVAIDFALMGILWFLVLVLEAYRGRFPRVALGFAGFGFVIVMGSRPDFGFWLLFIWPFLVKMLFNKNKPLAKRLLDFVPMIAVLGVGAILLMAYNRARFGSVLEFGQSYQLTLADMRAQKWTVNALPGSLFHYFFQLPTMNPRFPFFAANYSTTAVDTHVYRAGTIGLFFNPAFYLTFLLPLGLVGRKGWEWKASFALMPVTLILCAWSCYSFAGTCFRYLLVVYPLAAVMGLFGVASFESSPIAAKPKAILTVGIYVLAFGGAILGGNLALNSFDGMKSVDLNGVLYYLIRNIFGAHNA